MTTIVSNYWKHALKLLDEIPATASSFGVAVTPVGETEKPLADPPDPYVIQTIKTTEVKRLWSRCSDDGREILGVMHPLPQRHDDPVFVALEPAHYMNRKYALRIMQWLIEAQDSGAYPREARVGETLQERQKRERLDAAGWVTVGYRPISIALDSPISVIYNDMVRLHRGGMYRVDPGTSVHPTDGRLPYPNSYHVTIRGRMHTARVAKDDKLYRSLADQVAQLQRDQSDALTQMQGGRVDPKALDGPARRYLETTVALAADQERADRAQRLLDGDIDLESLEALSERLPWLR